MAHKSNPGHKGKKMFRPQLILAVLWTLLAAGHSTESLAQLKYYRYLNKDGVKVISHTIPPEYAQKGYEVITHTGKVIELVPAAPDPEDLARVEAERAKERALQAEYEVLARRYSSIAEIYSARDRRLAHLDANIAILRSNIGNIGGQEESLMRKAAEIERAGRDVPAPILKNLEEIRAELQVTKEMLQARLGEHTSIHAEYEQQVELFKRGRALEESKKNASRGN
jgi:chromosome segregation ATPase